MIEHVFALLEESAAADPVLGHATWAARAFDARLTLARAIDGPAEGTRTPADAVDWSLRRSRAQSALLRDATTARRRDVEVDTVVLPCAGAPARTPFLERDALVVLSRTGSGAARETLLDAAARSGASLLVVPRGRAGSRDGASPDAPPYRRVLVGVDCSSYSACAISVASELARAADAELILAYVVPVPEMPRLGLPYTKAESDLRDAVVRRNERVARAHLQRLGAELSSRGNRSRFLTYPSRRVGPSLLRVAEDERADLVVLGAHGTSEEELPSHRRYGSVAHAVMNELPVPLLVHLAAPTAAPKRDGRAPARHALNVPRHSVRI